MADIVIAEFLDESAIAEMLGGFDVLYDPALVDAPERLKAALAGARALVVRNRTQVRAPLLDAAPKLKAVGRLGVGLDNIDLAACRARGVAVFPATGANDVAVAEYVMGAALALVRGAFAATEAVLSGAWPRNASVGGELAGRMLGLVGFGAIARETARRARAFDMGVAAFDPYLPPADPAWDGVLRLDLSALLERADVLSLHTPLTAETRRMIDAPALARMKPSAVLVNAARGGVVDEAALAAALRSGRLGGAALDVFEEEPLTAAGAARFQGLRNLILTPHIAGVTAESNVRVSRQTLRTVAAALA